MCWSCDLHMLFFYYSLTPSTRYYYQFGSNTWGWSDEFSFKSPPVTSPDSSVRIITYGGKENTCCLSLASADSAVASTLCWQCFLWLHDNGEYMSVVMWINKLLHANYIVIAAHSIVDKFNRNHTPCSSSVNTMHLEQWFCVAIGSSCICIDFISLLLHHRFGSWCTR